MIKMISYSHGFQNLFFLLLFFIILFTLFYYSYIFIQRIFPEKYINETSDEKEDNKKEDFINLYSLQDFIMNDSSDSATDSNEEPKKELKELTHPKNEKAERRKVKEEYIHNQNQNQNSESDDKISRYLIDKGRYQYEIQNSHHDLEYMIRGYKDREWVHQIKSKGGETVSVIKNKIYNQYVFSYSLNDGVETQYYVEHRSSQPRFLKIYDEGEKHVFYMERTLYKSTHTGKKSPLYQIYDYAEPMGMIYLEKSQNPKDRTYSLIIDEKMEPFQDPILFGFTLYLSIQNEDQEL